MRLKQELYAQNTRSILADNIDRAWSIYNDKAQAEEDRKVAQDFLIYAFDIKRPSNLNEQLIKLMNQRNHYKKTNPDYIPGLSPKQLGLSPKKMSPTRTDEYKKTKDRQLNQLLNSNELLDVNPKDKKEDLNGRGLIHFLTREHRSQYRVHIHQRKFFKAGELFDTTAYEAHNKSEFAAFTINANGELSIFNHYSGMGGIVHSSMNSGSPVLCAGELKIKNGELIAINTFSGHYEPSLFNTYRALEYFSEKGVDISKAKIHLYNRPDGVGLNLKCTQISVKTRMGRDEPFYEVPASAFFSTIKEKLNKSLKNIETEIQSYQSRSFKNIVFQIKDRIIGSTLTKDRRDVAIAIQQTASTFLAELEGNDDENMIKVDGFIKALETLSGRNKQLSLTHDKKENNGRLHEYIENFLQQAQVISSLKKPITQDELREMKSIY